MLYNFFKAIISLYFHIFFKIVIKGHENISYNKGFIICANHTSNLDPPFVGICIPKPLTFLAKKSLFSIPIIGWIMKNIKAVPVNRGTSDISAIKSAISILNQNGFIAMFPEGTRIRTGEMGVAKAGIALIATKANSIVIPAAIIGNYKLFSKIELHIGKPISFEKYKDKKLSGEELAAITEKIVDEIKLLMGEKQFENHCG